MSAVTLTLPLEAARLIRTCIAYQSLGARRWAEHEDEIRARAVVARMEAAQRAVEAAIRASGYPVIEVER